jgi:hypothetical protein
MVFWRILKETDFSAIFKIAKVTNSMQRKEMSKTATTGG